MPLPRTESSPVQSSEKSWSQAGRAAGTGNEISQKPQSSLAQESRGCEGGSSPCLVAPGLEAGRPRVCPPPAEPLLRDRLSKVFQEDGVGGKVQIPGAKLTQPPKLHCGGTGDNVPGTRGKG